MHTAAVSRGAAVSDTPCTFGPAQSCTSADPTVTVNTYYSGDTSACTFSWDIDWGDGTSSSGIPIDAPADGYVFTSQHTYAAPGTYTIALVGEVTDGSCVETNGDYTFTLDNSLAIPSDLTATAVDPNDIRLNWQYGGENQTGFEINNGVVGRYAGADSTSYTWGGLAPGTYMCFKIRAYNSTGDSAWYPDFSPWYVCTTTPKSQPPPPPSLPSIKTLPYDNYAGYAAYPSVGYVMKVQAIWSVPSISCPLLGLPRAAAWVGMWGGTTSINNGTAWLPQIGTVSQCVNGRASYVAFWEMATLVTGQGNAPQMLNSIPVHPNDTIVASVAFLGPATFPNGYERRKFELQIRDTTDNKSAVLYEETSAGVQLGSVIRQGGAVIEDEPPSSCSVQDLPDCSVASPFQWLGHGLAKFDPPVHFSKVIVSGRAGVTWKYFEYVMRDGPGGSVLAQNSPLGLSNGMYYTITWKAQE
jgi:Peptidase A4 family